MNAINIEHFLHLRHCSGYFLPSIRVNHQQEPMNPVASGSEREKLVLGELDCLSKGRAGNETWATHPPGMPFFAPVNLLSLGSPPGIPTRKVFLPWVSASSNTPPKCDVSVLPGTVSPQMCSPLSSLLDFYCKTGLVISETHPERSSGISGTGTVCFH